jgi:hypothetical protein
MVKEWSYHCPRIKTHVPFFRTSIGVLCFDVTCMSAVVQGKVQREKRARESLEGFLGGVDENTANMSRGSAPT